MSRSRSKARRCGAFRRIAPALIALGLLALNTQCYSRQIVRPAPELPADTIRGADPQQPVRLVVLVLAENRARTSMRRLEWLPIEVVLANAEFSPRFFDRRAITPPAGQRSAGESAELADYREQLDVLANRLIQQWGPRKHPHIEYRPYINAAEYGADIASSEASNSGWLVIRLLREVRFSWNATALASCVTGFIAPSYRDYGFYNVAAFIGPDRQSRDLSAYESRADRPALRRWFGWLFAGWGPLAAADSETLLLESVNDRIREARAAGYFVAAEQRVDL